MKEGSQLTQDLALPPGFVRKTAAVYSPSKNCLLSGYTKERQAK